MLKPLPFMRSALPLHWPLTRGDAPFSQTARANLGALARALADQYHKLASIVGNLLPHY